VSKVEPVQKVEKINKVDRSTERHSDKEDSPYKTIEKRLVLDTRCQFKMNFYDAKVTLLPAKTDEVIVQLYYRLKAGDAETEQRLREEMLKCLIAKAGNTVEISTHFYKSYFSGYDVLRGRRIEIVLKDNTRLKVDEYEIADVKIFMPADADIDLNVKYGKVDMEFSLGGNFTADAYDAQVKGKSIRGDAKIESKYAKFEFEAMGKVHFNGYEAKLSAECTKDFKLNTKYSEIEIANMEKVDYKGYEDKLNLEKLSSLKADAKYCEIELEHCQWVNAILYEGKLEVEKAQRIGVNAKYVEMNFGSLRAFKIDNGYENEIDMEAVDSAISINGKYNEFSFEWLNTYLKLDGYEDDVDIDLLSKNFSEIKIDGKYLKLNLGLEKGINYNLRGTIQYPTLNVDKSRYKVVLHDKESDKLKFDYSFGKNSKNQLIQVDGYEVEISID
jgi:hypothetical protein